MHDEPDMDQVWIAQRVTEVAKAAIKDDLMAAGYPISAVSERYGPNGEYLLCCGLAEVVRLREGLVPASEMDGRAYGFEVREVGVPLGVVDPDVAATLDPELRSIVLAVRFVMAHLNDDTDTKLALFNAELTRNHVARLITGLLRLLHGGRPLRVPT